MSLTWRKFIKEFTAAVWTCPCTAKSSGFSNRFWTSSSWRKVTSKLWHPLKLLFPRVSKPKPPLRATAWKCRFLAPILSMDADETPRRLRRFTALREWSVALEALPGFTPLKSAGSKQCHWASLRTPSCSSSLQQIHPAKFPEQLALWEWFLLDSASGDSNSFCHLHGFVLLQSASLNLLQTPSGMGGVTSIWTLFGQAFESFSVNAWPRWYVAKKSGTVITTASRCATMWALAELLAANAFCSDEAAASASELPTLWVSSVWLRYWP